MRHEMMLNVFVMVGLILLLFGSVQAADEPLPSGAEREFMTDFSKHSVSFADILSGGPSKDGIPAIDTPHFVSVTEADAWLRPAEPVILFRSGDDARAYPNPDFDVA